MDDTPLQHLRLASSDFLDELDKRSQCKNCQKSRKYYCYSCYLPLPGTEDKIPTVKLPIQVDVIKHPNERDGKSTAVHAAVIAADDVKIYTYPVIPDYSKHDKVVLVYPGDQAVSLDELAMQNSEGSLSEEKQSSQLSNKDETDSKTEKSKNKERENKEENVTLNKQDHNNQKENAADEKVQESKLGLCDETSIKRPSSSDDVGVSPKRMKISAKPFDRVVFIDSTWSQTKKIYDDERIKDLPQVKLNTRKTLFWRHQKDKPDTYLATIEAIYYFLRDYHELFMEKKYDGQYDDLLFFFCYMYKKTRELYESGKNIKAYKDREDRGVMA